MQLYYCEFCGHTFEQNKRGTKHYCSDACKVAAHRARNPREDGYDLLEPAEKAAETKRSKELRSKTFPNCGMIFYRTGAQGKKKYCSDACKMAYHRRWDWDGKYSPKKGVEHFVAPEPVEVTYDEKQAVYDAFSEALE